MTKKEKEIESEEEKEEEIEPELEDTKVLIDIGREIIEILKKHNDDTNNKLTDLIFETSKMRNSIEGLTEKQEKLSRNIQQLLTKVWKTKF